MIVHDKLALYLGNDTIYGHGYRMGLYVCVHASGGHAHQNHQQKATKLSYFSVQQLVIKLHFSSARTENKKAPLEILRRRRKIIWRRRQPNFQWRAG